MEASGLKFTGIEGLGAVWLGGERSSRASPRCWQDLGRQRASEAQSRNGQNDKGLSDFSL